MSCHCEAMVDSVPGATERTMPTPSTGPTLFLPDAQGEAKRPRAPWTLPTYLQEQMSRRLWITGLCYSAAFFSADLVPAIATGKLAQTFRAPVDWIPTVTSILTGLVVAALASQPRISWRDKVRVGLLFQVLGSYGIAFAMYLEEPGVAIPAAVTSIPSWVSIWMIMCSVVVPAPP